jgi:phosphoribosylanthranilate isomerase
LGADWIGLNFCPSSPRSVSPERAAEISAALPPHTEAVGVFVDPPAELVADVAARVGLEIIQLHGQQTPTDLGSLSQLRLVKAFQLEGKTSWSGVLEYVARARLLGARLEAVLVDAYVPGLAGGTGMTIDDHIFEKVPPLPPLILAGGLTPQNVSERVARVKPWMVDVASGVESAPGKKDLAKVAAFIAAVRSGGACCQYPLPLVGP